MTTNEEIYNGNKASDFQPTTQDPQGNATGNLQPVSGGLQPTTSNENTQQTLPTVSSLKVENNGQQLSSPASTNQSVNVADSSFPLAFSVGLGLLFLVAVLVIWLSAPRSNSAKAEVEAEEPAPDTITDKPKKKKKKSKKSRSKRK